MEVAVDTHLCIRCSQTIVSIEAYLEHRRTDCLGNASTSRLAAILSENSSLRDVPELPDFFSSLDLQRINPVDTVDDINETVDEDDDPLRPPYFHTGGKWRPGSGPSIMQGLQRSQSPDRLPPVIDKMGCAPCGRIFRDKYTYQRHLESTLHRKRSVRNALILESQSRPVVDVQLPEVLLECAGSKEPFTNARRKQTPKLVQDLTPATSTRLKRKAQFRCSVCFKWFHDENRLKFHSNQHKTAVGDFRCEECGEHLSNARDLRDHIKLHKEHKECCGKTFTSVKGFREHKESIHAAIIEWLDCAKCSKIFKTRRALRDHRCGTETYSFACEKCSYIGNSEKNLKLHGRSHVGIKHFTCNQCDYRAARHGQLWRHKKQHDLDKTTYKCPHCDYTCASVENLRTHILKGKKHPGLKVYPCSKCSFATNSYQKSKHHLQIVHNDIAFVGTI